MIKLYNMDVMEALKQMPDESVDMQITSPPYWGLRDYGVEGQIGLEPDFNDYIKKMCDIFDEVKRVLKKDGTCWVNLGDTYYSKSGSGGIYGNLMDDEEQKYGVKNHRQNVLNGDLLPQKCLCCIPERFCLEMINRGWILRNKIIWHKPNHMPTSVKDRFANSWEYLFMFSKSKKYYFDLDAVREPHKAESIERVQKPLKNNPKGQWAFKRNGEVMDSCHPKGRNPDDVIQTPYAVAERIKEEIEYRVLPDIKEFAEYINKKRGEIGMTIDKVEEMFGNQAPHHWFNGESFPSVEDYKKLKDILKLDDIYDKRMTNVLIKPAEKQNHPKGKNPDDIVKIEGGEVVKYDCQNKQASKHKHGGHDYHELGKNPSDFWQITTQPYPESHFAVFPEKLVERPIKTTPKQICNKCGKPLIKKTIGGNKNAFNIRVRDTKKERIKYVDRKESKKELNKYNEKDYVSEEKEIIEKCSCNADFHPAVIMDIFAGSGTTGVVARRLHRDCILIEIKKEYCDLIYKRLFGNNQTLFPDQFKLIK